MIYGIAVLNLIQCRNDEMLYCFLSNMCTVATFINLSLTFRRAY